jgi:tRNA A37 methylthiotransferase MiaB
MLQFVYMGKESEEKGMSSQRLAALRESSEISRKFSQEYSARRDTPEKRAKLEEEGQDRLRRIENAAAMTQHRIDLGLTGQEYETFIRNEGLR